MLAAFAAQRRRVPAARLLTSLPARCLPAARLIALQEKEPNPPMKADTPEA